MQNKIIETLFDTFEEIRYVAVYNNQELVFKQKEANSDSSSTDTDKYEELLINPVLLTAASQRGNIDCGGLRFIIIGYGNFYQLIRQIQGGHISICLNKNSDLTHLPDAILSFLKSKFVNLF
jgi:hypothetical protein